MQLLSEIENHVVSGKLIQPIQNDVSTFYQPFCLPQPIEKAVINLDQQFCTKEYNLTQPLPNLFASQGRPICSKDYSSLSSIENAASFLDQSSCLPQLMEKAVNFSHQPFAFSQAREKAFFSKEQSYLYTTAKVDAKSVVSTDFASLSKDNSLPPKPIDSVIASRDVMFYSDEHSFQDPVEQRIALNRTPAHLDEYIFSQPVERPVTSMEVLLCSVKDTSLQNHHHHGSRPHRSHFPTAASVLPNGTCDLTAMISSTDGCKELTKLAATVGPRDQLEEAVTGSHNMEPYLSYGDMHSVLFFCFNLVVCVSTDTFINKHCPVVVWWSVLFVLSSGLFVVRAMYIY